VIRKPHDQDSSRTAPQRLRRRGWRRLFNRLRHAQREQDAAEQRIRELLEAVAALEGGS
jgi:hypothetical protein